MTRNTGLRAFTQGQVRNWQCCEQCMFSSSDVKFRVVAVPWPDYNLHYWNQCNSSFCSRPILINFAIASEAIALPYLFTKLRETASSIWFLNRAVTCCTSIHRLVIYIQWYRENQHVVLDGFSRYLKLFEIVEFCASHNFSLPVPISCGEVKSRR